MSFFVKAVTTINRPRAQLPCALLQSPDPAFLGRRYSSTWPRSEATFPVFRDVPSLRQVRRQLFRDGKQVGFVPTMGALHEGHLSLVRHALSENDDVFVSIFVNPTQFGVNEDLDAYPKTWEEDLRMLDAVQRDFKAAKGSHAGVGIRGIFAPTVKVMYPTLPPSSEINGDGSFVTITPLGKWLEGSSRPVFFRGVATVCTKLFNVVQPDRVYFGQKDVQQSVLIKRMVKDFHIPTEIRVIATSREPDGLAMSSRNVYLQERRRRDAVILSRALFAAQSLWKSGEISAQRIREAAIGVFNDSISGETSCQMEMDYIAISRPDDMIAIEDSEEVNLRVGAIVSAAMYVHPVRKPHNDEERSQSLVRLIDNVILEPRSVK